jgi:energy-coupling factor transporter ATP-binding protein EcfA2
VPEDALITANVSGSTVGVAGAQDVRIGSQTFISNFYTATPQAEIAKSTGPVPPCPYPGLAYFGPNDTSRFFGREQAIKALQLAVAKRSFTALVGASGSGKSSVVLAGLAPQLEAQGGWRTTYFRIGTEHDKNPFAALARALAPVLEDGDVVDRMVRAQKLAGALSMGDISLANVITQCRAANPGKRILLIADQFEEVFTLVSDEALRERFVNSLIEAFPDPTENTVPDACFVLTVRADFYNAALQYRSLADTLQGHVENLGPMTLNELREAIEKPAEAVGVGFEPGLVNTILDDAKKRPGTLPLLQFALREMWGRLKTPLMNRVDYEAIGGVEGALAKRAQSIFDEATQNGKDETQVTLFRSLFTRLVTLGEGAEDGRRVVEREELGPDAWTLAQKLANEDNRLVVTALTASGRETAEVVHEALIRNWPSLVEWVQRDRGFIAWRNQLKQRLDEWRSNPTDQGALLRGGPLSVAEGWVAQRGADLNEEESSFISASASLRSDETVQRNRDQFQSITLFSLILIIGILVPFALYLTNRMPSFPQFSDVKVITKNTSLVTTLIIQIITMFSSFAVLIANTRTKYILRYISVSISILFLSQFIIVWFSIQYLDASPLTLPAWLQAAAMNASLWWVTLGVNTSSLIMSLFDTLLIFMISIFTIKFNNLLLSLLLVLVLISNFHDYYLSPGVYFESENKQVEINQYISWLLCFSSFGGLVGIASALQFRTMRRRNQFKRGSGRP